MAKKGFSVFCGLFLVAGFSLLWVTSVDAAGQLEVTSSAFEEGANIPSDFTCDGEELSPPIQWASAPDGTKGFAVVVSDPDAPSGNWVHWMIYDLSPELDQLPLGISAKAVIPGGGFQGKNDFGKMGYGGPCPPQGAHRYFFKVYALDTILHLEPGVSKEQLERAMRGHILAEGSLMGRYERS